MGLLSDFAGAFATNIGNEMQQREEINYQLQIQEALERRRRQYQEEDYLRRRGDKNEDQAAAINASDPSIGYDDQGRQSLMGKSARVDPETRALIIEKKRLGDAPVTPTGRPFTVYDGQNKRTVQRFSDGSERDMGAPSPVRTASGSKSPDRQRFTTVTNPDGSKIQYDEQTGEKVRELPAKPGARAGKGDSADTIRKNATEYAKEVQEATGEVLNSLASQWGIDQRGLPSDEESKRIAILAAMEADTAKRLAAARGDKPKSEKSDDEAKAIAAARAAIDRGAPADAVLKRLREMYPGASL